MSHSVLLSGSPSSPSFFPSQRGHSRHCTFFAARKSLFFFFLITRFSIFFSTQIRFILIRSRSALTFFSRVNCVRPRSLEASNPPLNTYHKIKNPSKYKNNNKISIQIRNIELHYFCMELQINYVSTTIIRIDEKPPCTHKYAFHN